jgi:hypothetical protein
VHPEVGAARVEHCGALKIAGTKIVEVGREAIRHASWLVFRPVPVMPTVPVRTFDQKCVEVTSHAESPARLVPNGALCVLWRAITPASQSPLVVIVCRTCSRPPGFRGEPANTPPKMAYAASSAFRPISAGPPGRVPCVFQQTDA